MIIRCDSLYWCPFGNRIKCHSMRLPCYTVSYYLKFTVYMNVHWVRFISDVRCTCTYLDAAVPAESVRTSLLVELDVRHRKTKGGKRNENRGKVASKIWNSDLFIGFVHHHRNTFSRSLDILSLIDIAGLQFLLLLCPFSWFNIQGEYAGFDSDGKQQ